MPDLPYFMKIGGVYTEEFTQEIMEALNVHTVFTIPIAGGIPVYESVVVTWVIMAVLVLLAIIFVRNLKIDNPSKKQLLLEAAVEKVQNFFLDILGENGRRYIPYLMTVGLYIGISNIIGIFGFVPPTKDMNVTAALAIASIVVIEYSGIHQKRVKGWLKSFKEPVAVILPLNILEIFIRPVSLCMRLFGNVLGSFVIMELIKMILPVFLPIPFSFYFDIFDGLIQTYVFVFLTSLFMKEAIED